MTTLTKQQRKAIDKVNALYDAEVLDAAKTAIAGYMASGDKPEDAEDAWMRVDGDPAVLGGRKPLIDDAEIQRRLAVLMADDDLWNSFARYNARPDDCTLAEADHILRSVALLRVEWALTVWYDAWYDDMEDEGAN